MAQTSKSLYPERMNKTCVLYHKDTGTISHIHHAIVFEGGHEPTEHEIEAMARRSLEKRGLSHAELHALHLPGEHMKPFRAYRVDPDRKALVETEWTRKGR
jgi:hypothetical protein